MLNYTMMLNFREELRRRFVRAETMLFRLVAGSFLNFFPFNDSRYRIRYAQDDARERQQFIESLNVDWEMVTFDHRDLTNPKGL